MSTCSVGSRGKLGQMSLVASESLGKPSCRLSPDWGTCTIRLRSVRHQVLECGRVISVLPMFTETLPKPSAVWRYFYSKVKPSQKFNSRCAIAPKHRQEMGLTWHSFWTHRRSLKLLVLVLRWSDSCPTAAGVCLPESSRHESKAPQFRAYPGIEQSCKKWRTYQLCIARSIFYSLT